MVMLFYHLINSTHVRTYYSSSFPIFPLHATNRAQLSWTSLALSGLQWSFLNLHSDLHRPKDAPLQNAHLHPKRSLLVQGSAICRGILWVWSPGSCTLNWGICSDCNCNWFLKSAGKSHSVFDVKHSCISHKEMWEMCAFSRDMKHSRAQPCVVQGSTLAGLCLRGLCAVMAFIL